MVGLRLTGLLAVAGMILAACGPGGGGKSPTPIAVASNSATPSASTAATAVVPCVDNQTEPVSRASSQVAAAWAPYGVKKVPPCTLITTVVLPAVTHDSSFTDAQAQAIAAANARENPLEDWAFQNHEPTVVRALDPAFMPTSPEGNVFFNEGASITNSCAIQSVRVVALSQAAIAYMNKYVVTAKQYSPYTTPLQVGLVLSGKGPCSAVATLPNGAKQVQGTIPAGVTVQQFGAGSVVANDGPFGTVFVADYAGSCSDDPSINALCGGSSS